MVFTSNYANRNINPGIVKIRISVSAPAGVVTDDEWLSVAPNWYSLLKPYKDGVIDDTEYTRRYLKQLEYNKEKILAQYRNLLAKHKDFVLLCWCGKGKFCHRRLLADWLHKQGFDEIQEL